MNKGMLQTWGTLAVLTFAGWRSAGAQESLPPAGTPAPVAAASAAAPTPPAPLVFPGEPCAPPMEKMCGCWQGGLFFVRGQYLFLQPRRRASDFAIVDPNTDGKPQGPIESVFWDASSGLRVGGGYQILSSGWEIAAWYTYLHSHNDRALFAPAGGVLYATRTHPGFVDAVDTALGSSNLNYNVVDVEIGRRIEINDSFDLWLGGGARFAWIQQQMNLYYDGISAFQDHVSSPIRFDGAGLRFGGEGRWNLTRRLHLFGRAFGSILAGDFRTTLVETDNAGASIISDVEDRFQKLVPVCELGAGVGWQGENVRFRVGYEMINWFGLVDSPDFVHDFSNKLSYRTSDLSLDGLMVELGFEF
jgi:hypothetical protein